MSRRGLFIVLEGPEGSGKTSLLGPLADCMRGSQIDPLVVREPGGTRAAEIARQALLDPDHPVGPVAELFFYLAARADLVQTVISPALEAGRVVLSDRFYLSTEAYQMAGRGLDPAMVRVANQAAIQGVRPDLTLVLDLPPELGQARQLAAGKRQDRLDRESADFHRRVVEYYLAVKGEGVRHLDGKLSPDRLLQAAWAEVRAAAPETFQVAVR
jgi:dTMP kinase